MENTDAKKSSTRKGTGKMPSAPIKAPARNVKGIGRIGTFEGGLQPGIIPAGKGGSGSSLVGNILGSQGRKR